MLHIAMSGVDHTTAGIQQRECFSLTVPQQKALYDQMRQIPGLLGAVVISTCNRTEIYLSLADGTDLHPFHLLCQLLELPQRDAPVLTGEDAARSLCLLCCGARSRIFGEDQILTQVKNAVALSRARGMADGVLEVLFRSAITCGKRVRTEAPVVRGEASLARQVVEQVKEHHAQKVLVIGNGQMGRLAASALVDAGCQVFMTLRQYKYRQAEIPFGVTAFDYQQRYERLGEFDGVVSATLSPHYTLETERLASLERIPPLLLDLAVPRDIQPEAGQLPGVTLLDVDTLSGPLLEEKRQKALSGLEPYLERYVGEFMDWYRRRPAPPQELREAPPFSHFPFFVYFSGCKALVVGGGKIASRRVMTLLRFALSVTVVAPRVEPELYRLAEEGRIQWEQRPFAPEDLEEASMAVAATNDREVNRQVGLLARHRRIPVSVADNREECTFFFPAVVPNGTTVVAMAGDGVNHTHVAHTAHKIREALRDETEN